MTSVNLAHTCRIESSGTDSESLNCGHTHQEFTSSPSVVVQKEAQISTSSDSVEMPLALLYGNPNVGSFTHPLPDIRQSSVPLAAPPSLPETSLGVSPESASKQSSNFVMEDNEPVAHDMSEPLLGISKCLQPQPTPSINVSQIVPAARVETSTIDPDFRPPLRFPPPSALVSHTDTSHPEVKIWQIYNDQDLLKEALRAHARQLQPGTTLRFSAHHAACTGRTYELLRFSSYSLSQ